MLGSTMLEVAIGMAFIYTLLSLVCSMLREAVEACVKSRASDLELGIRNLLGSPDAAIGGINFVLRGLWPRKLVSTTTNAGNATSALLYKHPLVKSLYAGAYGPSYLPTQTFVAALFDIVTRPDPGAAPKALTVGDVMTAVQTTPGISTELKEAVLALGAQANDSVDTLRTLIGQWYEGAMDRVSGWYKRRTQVILLLFGLVVAALTNADTIETVSALASDQSVRQALVAQAEVYAKLPEAERAKLGKDVGQEIDAVNTKLQAVGLPFGWDTACDPSAPGYRRTECLPRTSGAWLAAAGTHGFGWLLTAFALTLGAPFWFDVLNKIMVIRSTVKPKEKSGEEGSEDRVKRAGTSAASKDGI